MNYSEAIGRIAMNIRLQPETGGKYSNVFQNICIRLGLGTQTLHPYSLIISEAFRDRRVLKPLQRNFGICVHEDPSKAKHHIGWVPPFF
jgi:hypothetical protein